MRRRRPKTVTYYRFVRVAIGYHTLSSPEQSGFSAVANLVAEAERLGVHTVWSAEAWGGDAFTPLAYIAARTSTIRLATGIAQVTARTPVMTAMTAMELDEISGGRMVLGLGVSGPQVVEGLHGVPYARPLERLRETVDVVRMAFRGEKLVYEGRQTVVPLPGGQGKALRLSITPHPHIPIHLAVLGPVGLEYTGATAQGWVGTCFVPEHADLYLDPIRSGAAKAGRSFSEIEILANATVAITDDVERLYASRRKALAFQISAMGSPTTNFYFEAYARMGYGEPCTAVRDAWLAGDRQRACALVPQELVEGTSILGTEAMVRERIRAYRDSGVTDLRVDVMGRSAEEKMETLAQAVELVRQVDAEATRDATQAH